MSHLVTADPFGSGASTPSPYLKGLSYYMNGAAQIATAADLTREAGHIQVARFQIQPTAFTNDTNGIKGRIDNYLNSGIQCIWCPWDDAIDTGGLTQAQYASHCADVANRFPKLMGIEVGNEVNYHYTAAKYASILEDSYNAIKAAQPTMKVCFANLDKVGFGASNAYFSVLDTHGNAVVLNNCDAVGYHGYKQLGPWDCDTGPTRQFNTNIPWTDGGNDSVNALPISTLLTNWMTSFHNAYGNIYPLDGAGKRFWCTEVGYKWRPTPGVVTASQDASVGGPPAGTYTYFLVCVDTSSVVIGTAGSALENTVPFTTDGTHGVFLSWPATNSTDVPAYDIWRLGTNSTYDIWDAKTADGAPYTIPTVGTGTFGFVARVNGTGSTVTYVDNSVTTTAHSYFGYAAPRGHASYDSPYSEPFVALQMPKLVAEYRKAKADVVAVYLGRSSFSNPSLGVFDPNYADLSEMVLNDGTTTTIWNAFKDL